MHMEIQAIADFHSPLTSKFGIPRQSGIVNSLEGTIVFRKEFDCEDAIRGLEGFDHIWIIWGFSANRKTQWQPTVRPPRLGGNKTMGVFATRSPYRPNPLGLSAVKITAIEGTLIHVSGADLMDGTPIYDIKPYIAYADSYPEAKGGFVDTTQWKELEVDFPAELREKAEKICGLPCADSISALLAQDPRPHYQDDPKKIYGMTYGKVDVHFCVCSNKLTVKDIIRL